MRIAYIPHFLMDTLDRLVLLHLMDIDMLYVMKLHFGLFDGIK